MTGLCLPLVEGPTWLRRTEKILNEDLGAGTPSALVFYAHPASPLQKVRLDRSPYGWIAETGPVIALQDPPEPDHAGYFLDRAARSILALLWDEVFPESAAKAVLRACPQADRPVLFMVLPGAYVLLPQSLVLSPRAHVPSNPNGIDSTLRTCLATLETGLSAHDRLRVLDRLQGALDLLLGEILVLIEGRHPGSAPRVRLTPAP